MRAYNLKTAIGIRPLTQPHTCERGTSVFVTMSRLKFLSTTSASFSIIPSTEGTNRENFLLIVEVLTVLIFIFLIQTIQEIVHWFILVGICIRVSKFDVDYGVSLDLP